MMTEPKETWPLSWGARKTHWKQCAEEQERQRKAAEEARAQLEPYMRHKPNCEFLTMKQGTPDFGGELRHLRPADCTCGLTALVQARRQETETPEGKPR